jgi:DNA ligase (NAD+)
VFTGVRRADLEALIQEKGGKIGSGVSKNTSVLVMKAKGSGSSKEQKAIELGIRILDVAELENELK